MKLFRFFKDLWMFIVLDFKRYYTFKERFIFDAMLSLIGFLSFALVWQAVFKGGFQGVGPINKENYVAFILSGTVVWEFITVNISGEGVWVFVREKYAGTIPHILVSPASELAYVYSKVVLTLVKILIDISLTLLAAKIFFNVTIKGNLFLVGLCLLFIFVAFSGFSLIIGILGAWREGFGHVSYVIGSLLYLVSGVNYPIEIFPQAWQGFLNMLPTTQSLNLVRNIALNNATFVQILPNLIYLLVFGAIFLLIGFKVFRSLQQKISLWGI